MQLQDFASIRLLGDGTSSIVQLVREKSTGLFYALKSVPEDDAQSVERGTAERNALLLFRGENRVIQFYGSFRENRTFYIVTEYLSAGDLFGLIHARADFSRNDARRYAAELLLAIEVIHKRDVIHRDLKPENIMIAEDGHLVLADFGIARLLEKGDNSPSSCVGTPEYCAPEVLLEKPYGLEIDLWAFGVILYEMLGHQLPFEVFLNAPRSDRRWMDYMIERVVSYTPEFRSCNFSAEAKDLLQKLLAKSVTNRLTSIPKIKKHPFFSPIDWQAMITRSRSSPRKPHLFPSERGLLHTPSSRHPPSHSILCTAEEDVSNSEISAHVTSPCLCGGRSDENTSPDASLEKVATRKAYLSLFRSDRHHRP